MNDSLNWMLGIAGIVIAWKGCIAFVALREHHQLRGHQRAHYDPNAAFPRLPIAPSIHQLAERAHARRVEAQRLADAAAAGPSQSPRVPQSSPHRASGESIGLSESSGHGYSMKRINGKQ